MPPFTTAPRNRSPSIRCRREHDARTGARDRTEPAGRLTDGQQHLLKIAVDSASGRPQEVAAYSIGSMMGGLHGATASTASPGQIWCTFQVDNKLVRVDPGTGLDTAAAARIWRALRLGTELNVSLLAHIPLSRTAGDASVDAASDYYSMMGLGWMLDASATAECGAQPWR